VPSASGGDHPRHVVEDDPVSAVVKRRSFYVLPFHFMSCNAKELIDEQAFVREHEQPQFPKSLGTLTGIQGRGASSQSRHQGAGSQGFKRSLLLVLTGAISFRSLVVMDVEDCGCPP